jgi:hypothetical protein
MYNESVGSLKDANNRERPSLKDTIYVGVGMPEVMASRIMYGCLMEEIFAALFQHGIITKEALSRALASGEAEVKRICDKMMAGDDPSPIAPEAVEQMTETAAKTAKFYRDRFIDQSQTSESP